MSARGNGNGGMNNAVCNTDLTTNNAVRCCADMATSALTCTCTSSLSCADLGWGAGRGSPLVCGASNLAHDGVTGLGATACHGVDNSNTDGFAHAAGMCFGLGARLCTQDEILADETQGTGCGHDADQTWTSTACEEGGQPGYYSARGNGNGGMNNAVCNTDLTANNAVRCCGDAVVGPIPCWMEGYEAPGTPSPCGAAGNAGGNTAAAPADGPMAIEAGVAFGVAADGFVNMQNCQWALQCPDGQTATVTFDWFVTEGDWDFVNLFSDASLVQTCFGPAANNGGCDNSGDLGRFSGSTVPDPVSGVVLVQAITDWSWLESGGGFEATHTCA